MRERHIDPPAVQRQHMQEARTNRELHATENHGRPAVAATARPASFSGGGVVAARAGGKYNPPPNRGGENANRFKGGANRPATENRPPTENRAPNARPEPARMGWLNPRGAPSYLARRAKRGGRHRLGAGADATGSQSRYSKLLDDRSLSNRAPHNWPDREEKETESTSAAA